MLGTPDANYDIGWADLPNPNSTCVLEKVAISGSFAPFITLGTNIAIGLKDKPLHLGFGNGDDYTGTLFAIGNRQFVFYDTEERRAWLVDGVSVVLHLLRAYLKFFLEDRCQGRYFTYSDGDIEEAGQTMAYTGAEAALDVLLKAENQNLSLYPKRLDELREGQSSSVSNTITSRR